MSKWIKLHTNFYSHRKTAKLRASIGDDAYWIPPRLWAYAAENQPDGIFSEYTAPEIANLIGYTKDAEKMLQALLQARFMDLDPLRIHDWQEYGGIHVVFKQRAEFAAKARWERANAQKESSKEKVEQDKRRQDKPSNASSIAPQVPVAPVTSAPPPPAILEKSAVGVLDKTDRISKERELTEINRELRELGALDQYQANSKNAQRILELRPRRKELRSILGVKA